MSKNKTLRQAIAEEEARLARIETEWAEALARLQQLKDQLAGENSAAGSPKPTLSEKIQSASEIPFEVDLVEKSPHPRKVKNPRGK